MTTRYRVTFEIYDEAEDRRVISSTKILDEAFVKPTNCFDYGMGQENQIALIQLVQDNILSAKTRMFINTQLIASFGFLKQYKFTELL